MWAKFCLWAGCELKASTKSTITCPSMCSGCLWRGSLENPCRSSTMGRPVGSVAKLQPSYVRCHWETALVNLRPWSRESYKSSSASWANLIFGQADSPRIAVMQQTHDTRRGSAQRGGREEVVTGILVGERCRSLAFSILRAARGWVTGSEPVPAIGNRLATPVNALRKAQTLHNIRQARHPSYRRLLLSVGPA
ncbi:hypothetical protein GQ53DRAFT_431841 [Thozetella sp. PMI_491]|nr:hypothetical protein GQ53DRAFT_431841 [Thozetella sp. PMI_491]